MEVIKLKDLYRFFTNTKDYYSFINDFIDAVEAEQSQLYTLIESVYPSPNIQSLGFFWDYFFNNGERTVSTWVEYMVDRYSNMEDTQFTRNVANVMYSRYYAKWKAQSEALYATYDILSPYDMTINETESNQLDTDTKIDQTTTGTYSDSDKLNSHNTGNTDSIYAFNSTENPVPTDKSVGTEDSARSGSGSNSGTKNITTDYGSKRDITRNLTRKGNIGNTTKQELIERELRLRDNLVYKIMFKDLNELLTRSVYTI